MVKLHLCRCPITYLKITLLFFVTYPLFTISPITTISPHIPPILPKKSAPAGNNLKPPAEPTQYCPNAKEKSSK